MVIIDKPTLYMKLFTCQANTAMRICIHVQQTILKYLGRDSHSQTYKVDHTDVNFL